jgi:hypothetical protein
MLSMIIEKEDFEVNCLYKTMAYGIHIQAYM